MPEEVWKDIEEFKGSYEASNLGRERSKERFINTRTYPAQIMRTYVRNNDCIMVRLRNGKSQVTRSVAKLVLLTFVGKPPKNAQQAKHLDGDTSNNRLDNLEWDVDKTYYMPPNQKARELFYKEAQKMVNVFCKSRNLNDLSFGAVDVNDLKQECLIAIWNAIDLVENERHFYYLCQKKCRWVFNKFYRKYKDKANYTYFSQIVNNNGECYAENCAKLSTTEYYDE